MVRDPRLLGDRADERRDRRDGEQRDRDECQAKPQLDQAQAVAPVEDRVSRVVLGLGFRLQCDLGGLCVAMTPHAREADTYPFVP